MARTVDIVTLFQSRFTMFQAVAAENWWVSLGYTVGDPDNPVPYPDGVSPSADQAANMEALETTYIQETPPAG